MPAVLPRSSTVGSLRLMPPLGRSLLALTCLGALGLIATWAALHSTAARSTPPRGQRFSLPLAFEENAGQLNEQIKFLARMPGARLLLTEDGATFALRSSERFHLRLIDAQRSMPIAEELLPGRANYFL